MNIFPFFRPHGNQMALTVDYLSVPVSIVRVESLRKPYEFPTRKSIAAVRTAVRETGKTFPYGPNRRRESRGRTSCERRRRGVGKKAGEGSRGSGIGFEGFRNPRGPRARMEGTLARPYESDRAFGDCRRRGAQHRLRRGDVFP